MLGALTISIDLELAWGVCDRELQPAQRESLARERDIVTRLLALFERYDVRATWAVVGHLLLERCEQEPLHPEIPRPVLPDSERDWFFQHPDQPDDPLWYGRDLVEMIRNARPMQDIGSHSFCHLSYARSNREAVEADIKQARLVHDRNGLPFASFVFPRNDSGRYELLREHGVRVVRGRTDHWHQRFGPRWLRRGAHLASYFSPFPPPLVEPQARDGMVDVPDSMLLFGRNGLRKAVPPKLTLMRAVRALELASSKGKVFHLWFHPSNFAHDADVQFSLLEQILAHAEAMRARGVLDVIPMSDHADRLPLDPVAQKTRQIAVDAHDANSDEFERRYAETGAYASSFAYGRREIDRCLEALLSKLPPRATVLDAGCGTGMQLLRLREHGFEVVGVEPSPRMRELAARRNPGVRVVDGVLGALPLPDAEFDLVISIEVLRYLNRSDILAGYRDMLRTLKPGGWAFFTMVNRWALDAYYPFYRLKRALRRTDPGSVVHCEFVTPSEVTRDLVSCGFEQVECVGRLVLPTRIGYKVDRRVGALLARALDPIDRALERLPQTAAFAGHLIVVARRPGS